MSTTGLSFDIGAWIERLIKVEQENAALRAELKCVQDAAAKALQETRDELFDYTASLDEEKKMLRFETGNEAGDAVYAYVPVAEVKPVD